MHDGKAIMYTPPHSVNARFISSEMINIVQKSHEQCIRKAVLTELQVKGISDEDIENCCGGERCCSFCGLD